jgi:amino acid adenylation domain-containing protein
VREQLLHDMLDRRAKLSPSKIALRSGAETWSYGRLRQISIGMQNFLGDIGVERGDRVLVLASAHPTAVPLSFACSRLGAIYVPVSPMLTPYQLRMIVEDCAPTVVVADAGTTALADDAAAGIPRVDLGDLAAGRGRTGPARRSGVISQDPVCVIYTSGSTAAPRGVVSTHAQVMFATRAIQARLDYRSADTVLCCLPLSFDYGLYQAFLTTAAGAVLCLESRDSASVELLATLQRTRATILPCIPTLAQVLRIAVARSGAPPMHLRMITNTGAALAPSLVGELTALIPGVAVVRMFGLTECKRVAIMPLHELDQRLESVGAPLDDTECFIVDEAGAHLPPGEIGELVVRGPNVMAGYWNAPELTQERFRRNDLGETLLWTGDLCHLDADGYLYHHGRIDEQYKENGFRVSAAEIEAAALDLPAVSQAALLVPQDGQPSCLVVTCHSSTTVGELTAQLATRIQRDKLPRRTVLRESMPLTLNGKIDKKTLRESL